MGRERKIGLSNIKTSRNEELQEPYGVIVHTTVIRDMGGIGFEHLGSQGQEIISAILKVSTDNYPELMKKCYMINTPWLFNTLWFFIKNLLAQRSIDKVEVLGTNWLDAVSELVPKESIPNIIEEGTLEPDEPFNFDLSCFSFTHGVIDVVNGPGSQDEMSLNVFSNITEKVATATEKDDT